MKNFEHYTNPADAEKAYLALGDALPFNDDNRTKSYVDWLYQEYKGEDLVNDAKLTLTQFSRYFGVREYDKIEDSRWYKDNTQWLSDCLYKEANFFKRPYDTACCDKMVSAIMKLLHSKNEECREYGKICASDMMKHFYSKAGLSPNRLFKDEYISFINYLSSFLNEHSKDLTFTKNNEDEIPPPKCETATEMNTPKYESQSEKYGEKWYPSNPDWHNSKCVAKAVQTIKDKYADSCHGFGGECYEVYQGDVSALGRNIIVINGGNNGSGLWRNYIDQIRDIFHELEKYFSKVWLVEIDNDCADDVYTMVLGARL